MSFLYGMLIFIPLALAARFLGLGASAVFATSALAMVPLAALIGRATEELATETGPRIGGLLNVTMGNAAELIIALVALHQGLTELVKASLAGSILSNALLVMGASMAIGGMRNGVQEFNSRVAGVSATMLVLAVIALSLEGLFTRGGRAVQSDGDREALSIGIAVVLLILYAFYIAYTVVIPGRSKEGFAEEKSQWGVRLSVGVLAASTVAAVVTSELLVGSVEAVVETVGLTELFLGIILVPAIGNAVEQWTAIRAAHRNHMELSLSIAIGASIQIASFTAPVLVIVGFLLGDRLQLTFNEYELAALASAVLIASFISFDGESNWIEGSQLIAVYVLFGMGFYFLV